MVLDEQIGIECLQYKEQVGNADRSIIESTTSANLRWRVLRNDPGKRGYKLFVGICIFV